MENGEAEKRCPLCDTPLQETAEEECYECPRCHSLSRFRGVELMAMSIPSYHLRLEELRRRNLEILSLIEVEISRGAARDMRAIRSLHEERQRVLSEYSFLSYFEQFVERW